MQKTNTPPGIQLSTILQRYLIVVKLEIDVLKKFNFDVSQLESELDRIKKMEYKDITELQDGIKEIKKLRSMTLEKKPDIFDGYGNIVTAIKNPNGEKFAAELHAYKLAINNMYEESIVKKDPPHKSKGKNESRWKNIIGKNYKVEKSNSRDLAKIEKPNFKDLAGVIEAINEYAIDGQLFGSEYAQINLLVAAKCEYDQKHDNNNRQKLIRQLETLKTIVKELKDKQERSPLKDNKDSRYSSKYFVKQLNFLLDENDITNNFLTVYKLISEKLQFNKFLPDTYTIGYAHVDVAFPSSSTGRLVPYHSSHLDERIISLAGPQKYDDEGYTQNSLGLFFKVFFSKEFEKNETIAILSLGKPGKDFTDYTKLKLACKFPLDEEGVKVENEFETLNHDKMNEIKIRLTKKYNNVESSEIKIFQLSNIALQDNHSVNFLYEDLVKFLQIYKDYQHGKILAVHCASGVGRTGHVRLIIRLLNRIKAHSEYKKSIDNLLDDPKRKIFNKGQLSSELKSLGDILRFELHSCRKIRYSVQDETQFLNSFSTALMLHALATYFEKGYKEETVKEYVNTLRNELLKKWALPSNQSGLSAEVTEFKAFCGDLKNDIDEPIFSSNARERRFTLFSPMPVKQSENDGKRERSNSYADTTARKPSAKSFFAQPKEPSTAQSAKKYDEDLKAEDLKEDLKQESSSNVL